MIGVGVQTFAPIPVPLDAVCAALTVRAHEPRGIRWTLRRRQPTFATPTGHVPVSAESVEWLVLLLRAERWLQEVDAIEDAGVSKPFQLDRVGNKVVFSILVGFAVLPDDLAALRDALAHA